MRRGTTIRFTFYGWPYHLLNDPGWYAKPFSSQQQETPSNMQHGQMKMDGIMQQEEPSKQGILTEIEQNRTQMKMTPPENMAAGHSHNGGGF